MKTISLAVVGLGIFIGSVAFAQEKKKEITKEQRMELRMEKLSKDLDLTEKQKVDIIELRKDSQEARLTLKNDESLDEAAKKSAMKTIQLDNRAKMAEILTVEQSEKLEEMKKERRENHKKKHPNGKHKGHKKDVKQNHRVRTLEEAPVK